MKSKTFLAGALLLVFQVNQSSANSKKSIIVADSISSNSVKSILIKPGLSFQLGGYTQVRYQSFQEPSKPDGFDVRLARIDFKGKLNKSTEIRLQAELLSNPRILDAYVKFNLKDYFKITAGQFYIPVSFDNQISNSNLESIDRPQVIENLVSRSKDVIGNHNGRDIGFQISGSFFKVSERFILDYYSGIFNGTGVNTSDNNEYKDYGVRLVLHPIKNLDLGGSYYNGFSKWGTFTVNQNRIRVGAELNYSIKALGIRTEFIKGQEGPKEKSGWYGQFTYFILNKKLQALARIDSFDPLLHNGTHDVSKYYVTGFTYWFYEWAKLQLNYSYKAVTEQESRKDIISTQLQINF